jgi:hypothetical protein
MLVAKVSMVVLQKGGGYLEYVGVCGCGWVVHTFTKISQHINMENNVAPMCVNVVPHGV